MGSALRETCRYDHDEVTTNKRSDLGTLPSDAHFRRKVLCVGRHELASRRRTSSVLLAVAIGPAAVFLAVGADVHPLAESNAANQMVRAAAPAVAEGPLCCFEVVTAPAAFAAPAPQAAPSDTAPVANSLVSASRWRVDNRPRLLPVGVAPEHGLQVRTILAARSISLAFPEINHIGGVRPDALRWHPNGLALDVMIPNADSAEGIALGNQIVAFVLKNAARFGMQDAIWRGVYYTPGGPRGYGSGHFDHVHITTTGGGYPTGNETYFR